MMSKAQDIFVHNKCEEVLSYAKYILRMIVLSK